MKNICPLLPLLTTCSFVTWFSFFFLCLIFCAHLFLPVVFHTCSHGDYNPPLGKRGLRDHLTYCTHHNQDKVCTFPLAFKILFLVRHSWDWDRNKNRALSMEYHCGPEALIYLPGDQRADTARDFVLSLQGGASTSHFLVTEEKKLSCFALLGYVFLFLTSVFSSFS